MHKSQQKVRKEEQERQKRAKKAFLGVRPPQHRKSSKNFQVRLRSIAAALSTTDGGLLQTVLFREWLDKRQAS